MEASLNIRLSAIFCLPEFILGGCLAMRTSAKLIGAEFVQVVELGIASGLWLKALVALGA